MIDLKGPVGVSSVSVEGVEYRVTNGRVSVKPEHVAALADMGFAPAPVTEDDPNAGPGDTSGAIDSMGRNELFAFIKAGGGVAVPPITNDQLRIVAHQIAADKATAAIDDAAKAVAEKQAADEAAAAEAAQKEAAAKAATGNSAPPAA